MTNIFLSYARGDDAQPYDPETSWVQRLARDLTAAGFDVWFDRLSLPSRGLTFHQEIRDAIAACDRLLLVVGPKAASSEYVQQEWQFAWFEAEKVVTPILRSGDYPLAIPELALLHAEDFRDDTQYAVHLKELIRILNDPAPPLGKLIGVPSLPAHYLSRTDRLIPLRDAVRSGLDTAAPFGGAAARQQFHGIAGTSKQVGVHGMGGIGKSVLANLLAHDREIRKAFPDGIVWVSLGSVPILADLMRRVHKDLGGDGAFATEHEGKLKLKELVADKALLLIIDDAWRQKDVEAFDILGPRCRALITTRDAGLLTSLGGTHHVVELLTDAEALRLLAVAADKPLAELPAEAHQVLQHCGRLPLAVALAGGLVVAGTPWASLQKAFERHKLEFLENEQSAEPQHRNLWKTIEISVQALSDEEQTRLVELAVFPEDEAVPEAAIATLWEQTGNLDDLDTQQLLIKLKRRSLIQVTASGTADSSSIGRVSMHDLIHDYCVRRAQSLYVKVSSLDDKLLTAYRAKCSHGWPTGPNDGYFFEHLRDHLVVAGRESELADLLCDLKWLEAKNAARLVFDLPQDFAAAVNALPKDDQRHRILQLLLKALQRDTNFIHRHFEDYPQALFQCLWNHAWWYDSPEAGEHYEDGRAPGEGENLGLHRLLERWLEIRKETMPSGPWLRTLRPPSTSLGSPLLQILRVDGTDIPGYGVAWSPDGMQIASGAGDYTVRVWDAVSGAEKIALLGHKDLVISVAWSPDGKRLATGSEDTTVRVWDAATGSETAVFRSHSGGVRSVEWSPDGKRLASGSADNTVRVWESVSGNEFVVFVREGRYVNSVAWSPDGSRIASGFENSDGEEDYAVRVWDVSAKREVTILSGHDHWVWSAVWSPDGRKIASGSADNTVRLWDVATETASAIFYGHNDSVSVVTWSPDGTRLASGSWDGTVRVWDAATASELAVLRGHVGGMNNVAWSPDGRKIVSVSNDGALLVWDAGGSAETAVLTDHKLRITSVAHSSDGQRTLSTSLDNKIRIWRPADGTQLMVIDCQHTSMSCAEFSPDGRLIVEGSVFSNGDAAICVWDAASGAKRFVRLCHPGRDPVDRLAFSFDSRRFISGSTRYKDFLVWDAVSNERLAVFRGHEDGVNSVAWSPHGCLIATGSVDKTVRVWDAASGAELVIFHGHEKDVQSVAWSPTGRLIASGSDDKTIRIWDVVSRKEIVSLLGHDDSVTDLAWSPNEAQIVSGSRDQTVRIWNAVTHCCSEVLRGYGDVQPIAAGAIKFPWRALLRDDGTVIEAATTGSPIAWFPEWVTNLKVHPGSRIWAGSNGSHLVLFALEDV